MSVTLEIAAFDAASALAAARAGADRIELCRDARAGGLTPSLDDIEAVSAEAGVPVVVMVRAHAEGWSFTEAEHAAMRRDAEAAVRAGATGVVWGALRPDGTVDAAALRALTETVAPHEVAFHRAFDHARDLDEALDTLLACGVARVLTGGGPGNAIRHLDRLGALVRRASEDLTVMPGGGIRAGNAAEVVARTGARALHAGPRLPDDRVDTEAVRALVARLGG